MVLCCLILVSVSVTFHITCVHIILDRFRLQNGHFLGNSYSLGVPYVLFRILTISNITCSYFLFCFKG